MGWMNSKALSVLLTGATLLLVGSCGSEPSEASTGVSDPGYWVLDRFSIPEFGGEAMVICRNKVMYVISDDYYGAGVQRVGYEKECA